MYLVDIIGSLPSASRTCTSTMSGLPPDASIRQGVFRVRPRPRARLDDPVDFDFGVAIQERLMDEDLSDDFHDDKRMTPTTCRRPPRRTLLATLAHPCPFTSAASPARTKSARTHASSATPILKQVHHKRRAQAKDSSIGVDINAGALPHTQTAWVGTHAADQAALEFTRV
ncbi:hypothetical protein B0H14DRAFT_3525160 [Mycena olivaceomarginata]|nr:hypothetical protein B0H14DRAFT_3525160 [Mycena olivaceomarginata]